LMADFFDRYLKAGPAQPIARSIQYYVLGAGIWRATGHWPPPESTLHKWYLGASHALLLSAPTASDDVDRYDVDFSATTGTLSGYRGQVDLSKTDYGDRAAADAHLLVYDSVPLATDTVIAGNPIAHMRLASSASDGLLIVYLEDVAPGGRVTYVSQGVLKLAFRKRATGDDSAVSADPFHTYLRADMAPMTPGSFEDIVLAVSPVAALIRKGHRIRVSLAGADSGNLERVPAQGSATLQVERGGVSYVELPQLP